MAKGSQKKIKAFWSELMNTHLPDYAPYTEKNDYLFNTEKAWWKSKEHMALLIIFSPSSKYTDQFCIELGWSKKKRFPELPVRPFISTREDISNPGKFEEATLRLHRINPETHFSQASVHDEAIDITDPKALDQILQEPVPDFAQYSDDNYQAVLEQQMQLLLKHGIPYLDGLQ